jgi:DNA-directed RNA polymerase sigma subunit (sigma70/sigma32)
MIGERFNVTAERIRQIERAVLGKMRGGDDDSALSSFL